LFWIDFHSAGLEADLDHALQVTWIAQKVRTAQSTSGSGQTPSHGTSGKANPTNTWKDTAQATE
jgi:hypothetical protein